jgi:hypothetical protein
VGRGRPTGGKAAQSPSQPTQEDRKPVLTLLGQYEDPVITINSLGAGSNKYGFEGGRVLKIGDTYQMITTEMVADPRYVKTKLAYWTSQDRIHWTRIATLFESSGECAGKDPRAALWGPMPVYDENGGRWNLFYVGYYCLPNTKMQWRINSKGRIWRAISMKKGLDGIGGPYVDGGIILQPGPESEAWEGLQGTDSFFPYRVGDVWYGFYGSANTEKLPVKHWRVGLASAPTLAGPWKRCAELNPVQFEKIYTENPIVTQLEDGTYLVVYDRATVSDNPTAIGYSTSRDGIHWSKGIGLDLQPKGRGHWANRINTPMGLIPEGNHKYTLFYTGEMGPPFSESIGFVNLKLEYTEPAQEKK